MKLFLKYHGPAILWALFVLVICSVHLDDVDKSPLFFEGFDKLTHCGLFFTLIVLVCFGVIRQQKPRRLTYTRMFIIWAVSILFGGLIEILQISVFTWRTGDWNDLFCDVLGACMGVFSVMLTIEAIGKNEKNKLVILLGALLLTVASSCGIFHKGCGCPHFGKIKSARSNVQMMA